MVRIGEDDRLSLDDLPLASRHAHALHIHTEADYVRVHMVVGRRRRPCLALVAGVHGNEYEGMVTLAELLGTLDPGTLDGSLIVVPVANPFAFRAGQRRTPQDDRDLNRADLVFTLHSAMADGMLAPWLEFLEGSSALERTTYAAAAASGFPDLVALPRLPGVLQTALAELGVPVIEGEVGGLGATTAENVAYYTARVMAVARHLGVLGRTADPAESRAASRIWHLRSVEAETDGVFRRTVELRQAVQPGEILGRLIDVRDGGSREVRSPLAAVVGGYRVHAGVRARDRLVTLWERAG
jgi:predicted deacylase